MGYGSANLGRGRKPCDLGGSNAHAAHPVSAGSPRPDAGVGQSPVRVRKANQAVLAETQPLPWLVLVRA